MIQPKPEARDANSEQPTPVGENAPMLVVGIGASAGGLEALEAFFRETPKDLGIAYVVVQHLSPDFKSVMDELLSRHARLPIQLATEQLKVEKDTIYLIPPGKEMIIANGRLHLTDKSTKELSLPIDIFFASLARERKEQAVGIVLSGTGSDGSRGVRAIKQAGGAVLIQSQASSRFDGMPRSAIEVGVHDYVLPPERMPAVLQRLASGSEVVGLGETTSSQAAIFEMIRRRFGVDFDHYKPSTVGRRIERRCQFLNLESVERYAEVIAEEPEEVEALYRDLLIGVTHFFRDPDAFEALRLQVIRPLVDEVFDDREIRVWVAGCATGEEAYTLAILFYEAFRQAGRKPAFRIFATDAHDRSIATAIRGEYPEELVRELGAERMRLFFESTESGCRVTTSLRNHVVFSVHNVLVDPPFTRLDLVTCRNLLIYLRASAQEKALSLFRFALVKHGALFLGPSETVARFEDEFDVVDRRWRILRKSSDTPLRMSPFDPGPVRDASRQNRLDLGHESRLFRAYDSILKDTGIQGALVTSKGDLIHMFGDSSRHFRVPSGRASNQVLEMVPQEVRSPLVSGLDRAISEGLPIRYAGIRTEAGGEVALVDLVVQPVEDGRDRDRFLLVQLHDRELPEGSGAQDETLEIDMSSSSRLAQLEAELQYTRKNLQAAVEEMETANEELQATNEELMASNEELQSTNEELHSVNEELFTVNAEHQRKIEELTRLTDDMNNLLESTEIGTIFLDRSLCIRRYTPRCADLFSFLPQDIGRPIEHITSKHVPAGFLDLLREVLRTGVVIEREIQIEEDCWFQLRILPYRTSDDRVEGVVLIFLDVSSSKRVQDELQELYYVSSHELKKPVRHLRELSERLLESEGKEQEEERAEWLGSLAVEVDRVDHLVNQLLEYSRVKTRAGPYRLTSLTAPATDAVAALQDQIEEAGATVEVEDLPSAVVDQRQFRTVFKCLLANSLQFRDKSPLHVRISGRAADGSVSVFVEDNGRGITKADQKRVFDAFVRVDPSGPGAGMGLAIVRRVLDGHRGTVRVETASGGRGCRFVLDLPFDSGAGERS